MNNRESGISWTGDICRCILLARKSQHASSHIDRTDSSVDVRYLPLYLLARKITTCIIAHRSSRFARRGAITDFSILLARKITQCIIAHRPKRFVSRCAISAVVSRPRNPRFKDAHTGTKRRFEVKRNNRESGISGTGCIYLPENHNIHHRTSTDSIRPSRCDICRCIILARKITTCIIARRPIRFDSPVEVRYLPLYSFGQKNHNMHHRTSTETIRPSRCDQTPKSQI